MPYQCQCLPDPLSHRDRSLQGLTRPIQLCEIACWRIGGMILLYQDSPVSVYGFNYQLGGLRRDLTQLKSENVLANTEETLSAMGYRYCLSLDKNETLLSLAAKPVTATLAQTAEPRALVFQHCHAESAVLPVDPGDTGSGLREITILRRQYCRN